MSDEREAIASRVSSDPENTTSPGAPIEESEASRTEVLRAVERSKTTSANGSDERGEMSSSELSAAPAGSRAKAEASNATVGASSSAAAGAARDADSAVETDAASREDARRAELSQLDTQLDLDTPGSALPPIKPSMTREEREALPGLHELPSAGTPVPAARDGEIRISPDHPMAGLYLQSPIPPDMKGNRGAGVLIALVATVGFALVFAGVLALWLAPTYPPSTFLTDAFLPWITSWPAIAAVVAFFVGLALIVLIVGRAGWWAYVLGGFVVAALVWAAVTVALAYFGTPFETPGEMLGGTRGWSGDLHTLVTRFGLTVPALGAALVAREATVWFGAWIGARGRRMKLRNARELAAYETALAESKAESRS
ncbi:hypothetical protein [Leucobacter sp. USHLN153]|uniref:hypothetical protein n=1 Tax=Leucobacter sp. USHLN153 TaxID=3081268 RepID=UPI0030162172